MFGLVFIYFIWKYFADLAAQHQKNKWAWGIGAVVFYYAVQLFLGVIIGRIYVYTGIEIGSDTELIMNLVGLIVSIPPTIGLYYILKNSWQKQARKTRDGEILD